MTILADTVDIVIGVDPHKHTHTATIVAADTGKHHTSRTSNADPNGFAEFVALADEHEGSRCRVIEGCGRWGRGLATWLLANGEDVREIDNTRRPARRMGRKTDDLDALRVAREALGRDDLATPGMTGDRDALAALLVVRRSAVEMTGDAERQLVSLAVTCPEPLAQRLRGKSTAQIVEICARWRPTGNAGITGTAEAMRALARGIRDLRVEAKAHQTRIADLATSTRPDLLELVGVGPIIAATALVVWSHPGRIQRQRVRDDGRCRTPARLIRTRHSTPAQPARRPTPQQRAPRRSDPASTPRPSDQGLHRTTPRRGQDRPPDPALPQALLRTPALPNPRMRA